MYNSLSKKSHHSYCQTLSWRCGQCELSSPLPVQHTESKECCWPCQWSHPKNTLYRPRPPVHRDLGIEDRKVGERVRNREGGGKVERERESWWHGKLTKVKMTQVNTIILVQMFAINTRVTKNTHAPAKARFLYSSTCNTCHEKNHVLSKPD